MTAPTTQRDEIRQLLAAASEPLTRPEIFAQCKLVDDEVMLSTVLSQLVKAGEIERAGECEREKGAPLALYTTRLADAGGYGVSAPKSARRAKRKGKKPAKQRRASAYKKRRSARTSHRSGSTAPRSGSTAPRSGRTGHIKTTRSGRPKKRVEKVSPDTSRAPAPEGFRCGIYSDGTLAINAEDGQLTLSEPETRAMFKYLDRVLDVEARG